MKEEKLSKLIVKTIGCIMAILIWYYIGGAISVIRKLDQIHCYITQGIMIWISVFLALLYVKFTKQSFVKLGFCRVKKDGWVNIFFCIPVLLLILVGTVSGFEFKRIANVVAAFFMTTAVGFSEEIYYRMFIFRLWKSVGVKRAVLISSVLFGVCHLLNIAGGRGVAETLLQVAFAFFYGIVFALMFALCGSVIPGIAIHLLHNFVVYMTKDVPLNQEIVIGAIQVCILVVYSIFMYRVLDKKLREQQETQEKRIA